MFYLEWIIKYLISADAVDHLHHIMKLHITVHPLPIFHSIVGYIFFEYAVPKMTINKMYLLLINY